MLASSRWMGLAALLAFQKTISLTHHAFLARLANHFPFLFYGNYPPLPLILPTKTFTIRLNITAFAERK